MIEWMMMLVLNLNGWIRYGVVIVLFMMSGMLFLCVMLVMVWMLRMLICGLLMVFVKNSFVFGWIVWCYFLVLFWFFMNVILMLSFVSVYLKRLYVLL